MSSSRYPAALFCSLLLAACQSPPPARPQATSLAQPSGPITIFPDVEMFGENPLLTFQRTGSQPVPITTLPAGTPLQILGQSGAFYHVATPSNLTGWIAARSISGATGGAPDWSNGTPTTEPQAPTTPLAPGIAAPVNPAGEHDNIDLDRL